MRLPESPFTLLFYSTRHYKKNSREQNSVESLLNISPKIGIEIKKKGKILYSPSNRYDGLVGAGKGVRVRGVESRSRGLWRVPQALNVESDSRVLRLSTR